MTRSPPEPSAESRVARVSWVIAVAVLVASGVWLYQLTPERLAPLIAVRFPDVGWVEPDRLASWLSGDPASAPVLLDARGPDEFAVSHLPGAVRIDPDTPNLDAVDLTTGGPIVVYCSIGWRSGTIAEALLETGATDVYNLRGGIFGWANEGRPVVRDGAPADLVHPYDALWGRLLRPALRERGAH